MRVASKAYSRDSFIHQVLFSVRLFLPVPVKDSLRHTTVHRSEMRVDVRVCGPRRQTAWAGPGDFLGVLRRGDSASGTRTEVPKLGVFLLKLAVHCDVHS